MTYDSWRITADPYAMLDFLFPQRGSGSSQEQPRKLRLYFCALARISWPHLPAPMKATVEAAEHLADSIQLDERYLSLREFLDHTQHFEGHPDDIEEWKRVLSKNEFPVDDCGRKPNWRPEQWQHHYHLVALPLKYETPNYHWIPRSMHRSDLIRDVFEYPFIAQNLEASWRNEAVVAIAKEMYRTRDFSMMPIFADVLEEAGCNESNILNHCRDGGQIHIRGCWVIDRVLTQNPFSKNEP